jgi:hypothetical protein
MKKIMISVMVMASFLLSSCHLVVSPVVRECYHSPAPVVVASPPPVVVAPPVVHHHSCSKPSVIYVSNPPVPKPPRPIYVSGSSCHRPVVHHRPSHNHAPKPHHHHKVSRHRK